MTGGYLPPGHPPRPFHPLANIFPMLSEAELDELGEDIKANGQAETVKLHKGMILDGRNRYTACTRKGLGVQYEIFAGSDREALAWVISKNLKRRHLDESQRAMVAARIATLKLGDNQHSRAPAPIGTPSLDLGDAHAAPEPAPAAVSQTEAAELVNAGRRSVQRAAVVVEKGAPEVVAAVETGKVAVSIAEKIARLPQAEQPAALEKALPAGSRAIMSSRQEPDASLDFFPTPPWATRALVEHVLIPMFDTIAIRTSSATKQFEDMSLWEPACGEGHMAEVLREYGCDVIASDVFDYGYGDRTLDFLTELESGPEFGNHDFIVTNPPFGDKGEAFVLQALKLARLGVAMFVRLQWLETVGRYENIFRDNPPTLIAFFAERVNLCKGRWDPEGGTATAYVWLIWIKGDDPQAPFWIPPGCREALSRPDDVRRFTAHPVIKATAIDEKTTAAAGTAAAAADPTSSSPSAAAAATLTGEAAA
jgi:ParB-like chromosome segregation protein Spo0J